MHIYLALAALAHLQSCFSVTAAPLTTTSVSPIVTVELEPSISSAINRNSTALRNPNIRFPSNQSNTTSVPLQEAVPYRVRGSSTLLLFHSFGAPFPSEYLLASLSLSLSTVLEFTLQGKGREPIAQGFFIHTHVMPTGDSVSITVADFREIGRPMNYYALRDTLSGIGDFVTEPERSVTPLSYEVEVDGLGYVGTGHVDYEPASRAGEHLVV